MLLYRNDIGPFELSQQSASNQIAWIAGEQGGDKIRERRFLTFGKNDRRHRACHSVHAKQSPIERRQASAPPVNMAGCALTRRWMRVSMEGRRKACGRQRNAKERNPDSGSKTEPSRGVIARGVCIPVGSFKWNAAEKTCRIIKHQRGTCQLSQSAYSRTQDFRSRTFGS